MGSPSYVTNSHLVAFTASYSGELKIYNLCFFFSIPNPLQPYDLFCFYTILMVNSLICVIIINHIHATPWLKPRGQLQ